MTDYLPPTVARGRGRTHRPLKNVHVDEMSLSPSRLAVSTQLNGSSGGKFPLRSFPPVDSMVAIEQEAGLHLTSVSDESRVRKKAQGIWVSTFPNNVTPPRGDMDCVIS